MSLRESSGDERKNRRKRNGFFADNSRPGHCRPWLSLFLLLPSRNNGSFPETVSAVSRRGLPRFVRQAFAKRSPSSFDSTDFPPFLFPFALHGFSIYHLRRALTIVLSLEFDELRLFFKSLSLYLVCLFFSLVRFVLRTVAISHGYHQFE